MPDIETNLSENIIWVGNAAFEAHADRLIILQDDYRSGFECPKCLDEDKRTIGGKEVSVVPCEECGGKGVYSKEETSTVFKCSVCDGAGIVPCPECGGKGGTIILAENTKGRPTTGTIVSVGWLVDTNNWLARLYSWFIGAKRFQRGQKVIYPSFAGHAYDLKGYDRAGKLVDVVLVILRDSEILSRMYGSLEQNQVKRSAALHTAA